MNYLSWHEPVLTESGSIEPQRVVLWTVKDCADYLRTTPRTVYRLMQTKRLPYTRPCGVRFDPDKVERWLATQK